MRSSTAYNYQSRAISHLRDAYAMAQTYGIEHERLIEHRRRIFDDIAKCPQHVKSYVYGYDAALNDQMWKVLVSVVWLPDGRVLSTHSDRSDYYGNHGLSARDCTYFATHQGFAWDCRGELRTFYKSQNDMHRPGYTCEGPQG